MYFRYFGASEAGEVYCAYKGRANRATALSSILERPLKNPKPLNSDSKLPKMAFEKGIWSLTSGGD
jgi:hypothetical protein